MKVKTGFYNLSDLDEKQLKLFYKEAVMLAYKVHIDKLDSRISWSRNEASDKSISSMINNITVNSHNKCIDRSIQNDKRIYAEITSSVIGDTHMLFIELSIDHLELLTKVFNLKMEEV